MKRIMGYLLTLTLFMMLTACNGDPDLGSDAVQSRQQETESQALGEAVTFDGLRITPGAYRLEKSLEAGQGRFFHPLEEKNSFLVIDIAVKNTGSEAKEFLPLTYHTAADVLLNVHIDGVVYESSYLMGYESELHSVVIEPGEEKNGVAVFELPLESLDALDASMVVTFGKQQVVYPLES